MASFFFQEFESWGCEGSEKAQLRALKAELKQYRTTLQDNGSDWQRFADRAESARASIQERKRKRKGGDGQAADEGNGNGSGEKPAEVAAPAAAPAGPPRCEAGERREAQVGGGSSVQRQVPGAGQCRGRPDHPGQRVCQQLCCRGQGQRRQGQPRVTSGGALLAAVGSGQERRQVVGASATATGSTSFSPRSRVSTRSTAGASGIGSAASSATSTAGSPGNSDGAGRSSLFFFATLRCVGDKAWGRVQRLQRQQCDCASFCETRVKGKGVERSHPSSFSPTVRRPRRSGPFAGI
ncbi:unnamed protein product [Prorocentrum cordatum]|uniref:Uncharacterized protein n=1 Tax=Prorocentrum cordatum TaxID=2364126 RepID=A0ABN9Y5L2_9DINO|nr:unnamed protein product [Polarella glacialis]